MCLLNFMSLQMGLLFFHSKTEFTYGKYPYAILMAALWHLNILDKDVSMTYIDTHEKTSGRLAQMQVGVHNPPTS